MKQETKNLLLLGTFFLLLFVAYKYSFSKTFEIKEQLDQLHIQISQNSQLNNNPAQLATREKQLDSIINKNVSGNLIQNDLLEVLNNYSGKDLKIISFGEPHIYIYEDKTEITSYRFILEGQYKDLEAILYSLEKNYSFGSLAHISFNKKKDYRENKTFLQCSVVVQHVK